MSNAYDKFIIDTSSLINLVEIYPPDHQWQTPVWSKLSSEIKSGRLLLLDVVHAEIKKYQGETYLKQFCLDVKRHIFPVQKAELFNAHLQEIVKVTEKKFMTGGRNSIERWFKQEDIWIVAQALSMKSQGTNVIIITDEAKLGENSTSVKITSVCGVLQIPICTSQKVYSYLVR